MMKLYFSAAAITLTLIAFTPYIYAIIKGKTKPHVFSWVIWGTTTAIVFFAMLESEAGVGAWPAGVSAVITFVIAWLAFLKRSDSSITHWDWLFFLSALLSLPFWYFTDNPLWAVIILTTVDLLGFGPTLRKAYTKPYEENILFFSLFLLRNSLVIAAMENYSVATVLFPLAVGAACIILIALILVRRKQLHASDLAVE